MQRQVNHGVIAVWCIPAGQAVASRRSAPGAGSGCCLGCHLITVLLQQAEHDLTIDPILRTSQGDQPDRLAHRPISLTKGGYFPDTAVWPHACPPLYLL
jgi:hypothetical protein